MKLERKWMRFKPLISSWRREGRAYETVALKAFNIQPKDQRLVAHQEQEQRFLFFVTPPFFSCAKQDLNHQPLNNTCGEYFRRKPKNTQPTALCVTRLQFAPHAAATAFHLSRSVAALWTVGGNPELNCVIDTSINFHSLAIRYQGSRHIRIHGRVAALSGKPFTVHSLSLAALRARSPPR